MEEDNVVIYIGNQVYGMDDLVDYKDAAKIMSISEKSMQRLGYKRKLPVYLLGKRTLRFLVSDLCRYADLKRIDCC